jgi:hypothetical protein
MAQKRTRRTPAQMAEARGLGDTIEKVLKATGVDKVAKFLLGEDCGCEERKQKLNLLFPYRKPLCLTEDEYNYLNIFFSRENKTQLKPTEQLALLKISNRIFKEKQEPTTCKSCVIEIIERLSKVYEEYK